MSLKIIDKSVWLSFKRDLFLLSNVDRNILFVCGFSFTWRIFHSNGYVTINGEGLQIRTHTQWAVRVLQHASHTMTRVIRSIFIFEDPWHLHLLPSAWHWSCRCLFNDLGLSRSGDRMYVCTLILEFMYFDIEKDNTIIQWKNVPFGT